MDVSGAVGAVDITVDKVYIVAGNVVSPDNSCPARIVEATVGRGVRAGYSSASERIHIDFICSAAPTRRGIGVTSGMSLKSGPVDRVETCGESTAFKAIIDKRNNSRAGSL